MYITILSCHFPSSLPPPSFLLSHSYSVTSILPPLSTDVPNLPWWQWQWQSSKLRAKINVNNRTDVWFQGFQWIHGGCKCRDQSKVLIRHWSIIDKRVGKMTRIEKSLGHGKVDIVLCINQHPRSIRWTGGSSGSPVATKWTQQIPWYQITSVVIDKMTKKISRVDKKSIWFDGSNGMQRKWKELCGEIHVWWGRERKAGRILWKSVVISCWCGNDGSEKWEGWWEYNDVKSSKNWAEGGNRGVREGGERVYTCCWGWWCFALLRSSFWVAVVIVKQLKIRIAKALNRIFFSIWTTTVVLWTCTIRLLSSMGIMPFICKKVQVGMAWKKLFYFSQGHHRQKLLHQISLQTTRKQCCVYLFFSSFFWCA